MLRPNGSRRIVAEWDWHWRAYHSRNGELVWWKLVWSPWYHIEDEEN